MNQYTFIVNNDIIITIKAVNNTLAELKLKQLIRVGNLYELQNKQFNHL